MQDLLRTLPDRNAPLVISAPLAGITDAAFQRILHECRSPVICTEMIPSPSIARHPKAIRKLLSWQPGIHPIIAQIYGYSPDQMAQTADILKDYAPDGIDINMGCPAKKIFRNGSGLALMNDLPRAAAIVRAVRRATAVPLSIKIRLGVDPGDFQAPAFARMAEAEGVDFITVHGRYRTSYSVPADWDRIADVKAAVTIPVIGNGDILTPDHARDIIRITGCDGVMVARGILGNPWLPRRIFDCLTTGVLPPEPTLQERFRVFSRHLEYLIASKGERRAGLVFRKHAAWYLKGFPNITRFRRTLFTFSRPEQFYGAVRELMESYGIPLGSPPR